MAGEDIMAMSRRELKRLHIIKKVLDKVLTQVEASEILSLSSRQIRRIVKKIREEGDNGIAHGLRGKTSVRRIPKNIKGKVIKFYREKYEGFGPTLLSEKLLEEDGIKISKETLRNWLIGTGDWKKERKSRTHRQWRERRHYFGEMVQMDGSRHDWLEGRCPELVLMAYIDDATNMVYARFYDYEGTIPAMESFKHYIKEYGLPISIYLDRHTTYKSTGKPTIEDELANKMPKSQFERALEELGVRVIHAYSPQAKGRIERLFKTLQDRLIKEMRLKNIKTKEEANEFLKHYLKGHNKRFGLKPAKEANLHRNFPKDVDMDRILCIKTKRTIRNDFTISHDGNLYQITEHVHGKEVIVEERIDGSMHITCDNRRLKFKEIASRPFREEVTEPKMVKAKKKKVCMPPKNHPWRRYPLVNRYNYKEPTELLLTET
jgi:nicotinamide riboside kinase